MRLGKAVVLAVAGAVEQLALKTQLLDGGVTRLVPGARDPHDLRARQDRVGLRLKSRRHCAVAVRGGERLDDVAARERARPPRQLA